ncbi:MAG: septum site-determining protein MinC [Vulcanimicrobiota bacterium]
MQTTLDPVVIKGTRHGLLGSIREEAEFAIALRSLAEHLETNGEFLRGASVSFDFGWRETTIEQFEALEALLAKHEVVLNGILSTSLNTRSIAESKGYKAIIGRLGLAQHQGRALRNRTTQPAPVPEAPPKEPSLEAEPSTEPSLEFESVEEAPEPSRELHEEPTLYLRRNLRSGQKVMFAGNVVLVGDVNPGAEIEAEGDILIIGSLRGNVHAGCTGNHEAVVMAVSFRPTQVRINDIFLETSNGRRAKNQGPSRAVLVGKEVRLEPYSIR